MTRPVTDLDMLATLIILKHGSLVLPDEEVCLCKAGPEELFGGSAKPIRSGLSDVRGLLEALLPLPPMKKKLIL